MLRSDGCPSRKVLKNWADGLLGDSQVAEVEDHLDLCSECDRYASGVHFIDKSELDQGNPQFIGEEECADALERIVGGNAVPPAANETPSANHSRLTLTGMTIRDYKLVRQLATGGMGTVYLASHLKLQKDVAIKVLRTQVSHNDPSALARFQREMRAVGQLDHPNIVRALDAGDDAGLYFLAMELIEGVDLSDLSKGKRSLSVEDACEITRQAAIGLQHAHEQGLVHRDIKPSNIMLSCKHGEPVRVKILDLGLALLPESGNEDIPLTAESQLIGTLEYMAPEQADGLETLDHLIDVYSLGVTLYRLLTGSIPFRGPEFKNPLKRLKALTTLNAPSVALRRTDLPRQLVVLVDQMIARDPARRPQTMSEVAKRISQFCPATPMLDLPKGHASTELDSVDFSNARNLNEADTSPTACDTLIGPVGIARFSEPTGARTRKPAAVALLALLSFLCAGVLWLKTDGAYVRVEAESDIEFTVEVIDSLTDKNVDSFRIGQGQDRFWLETGSYRIELSAGSNDSVTLEHEKLTVERGGKPVLRVSRVSAGGRDAEINRGSRDAVPDAATVETESVEADSNPLGWKWTTPINLGTTINTEWKDDQPTLSADGLTMIFSSYCIPRFTGEGDRDLWMTVRSNKTDEWSTVVNLGPVVNTPMKEMNPAFHQPSRSLIFASNREGGIGGADLWYSVLAEDELSWSSAVNSGTNVNSAFDDDHAEVSADGLTLYFTSNRPATTDGNNVWYCTRKSVTDQWGVPLELKPVNSDRDELAPALSSDQLTLVFCSEREGGFGDKDLWATTRDSVTEEWRDPFNLGSQINTASVELHATFGENDQTLIFSSDRKPSTGATDLWTTTRSVPRRISIPTATPTGAAPLPANQPFDGEQASLHQHNWSNHLQIPVSYTNSIGMPFTLIPPGEFRMGAAEDEFQKVQATKKNPRPSQMNIEVESMLMDSEFPARTVTLSKAFYMGCCEVRERDFEFVIGIEPPMKSHGADFPVGMVSWLRAARFCNTLNQMESMPVRYEIDGKKVKILDQAFGYRLPSEAEWEFSCRAGCEAAFPFGDDEQRLDEFAWYNSEGIDEGSEHPASPVGQKKPNAFGLFDMLGNHWEWCEDAHQSERNLPEPWGDPMFRDNSRYSIAKGGFVLSIPIDLRSARRRRHLTHMVYRHAGFRVVLVPKLELNAAAD